MDLQLPGLLDLWSPMLRRSEAEIRGYFPCACQPTKARSIENILLEFRLWAGPDRLGSSRCDLVPESVRVRSRHHSRSRVGYDFVDLSRSPGYRADNLCLTTAETFQQPARSPYEPNRCVSHETSGAFRNRQGQKVCGIAGPWDDTELFPKSVPETAPSVFDRQSRVREWRQVRDVAWDGASGSVDCESVGGPGDKRSPNPPC